jgi:hypothetical protein
MFRVRKKIQTSLDPTVLEGEIKGIGQSSGVFCYNEIEWVN